MAETRNLTILFTDIKGFTDKTSHQSRADMLAMLDEHNKIVLPVLQSKGGRLIKTIGDAFLMTFDSPTDAVLAGIAVQDALRERNKDKAPEQRIEVRVAINSGEVSLVDNDVFGEPVNIAARIEGVAGAGEVFFTEAVYLAMNKSEVPSSEVGLLQLKGIPEKIRVYRVKTEQPVEGKVQHGPATPPMVAVPVDDKPAGKTARTAVAAAPAQKSGVNVAVQWPGGSANIQCAAGLHPASLVKRAGALLIDLTLVAVFLAVFFGGGSPRTGNVHIHQGAVKIDSSDAYVKIDDKGVDIHRGDEGEGSDRRGGAWKFALAWFIYNLVFVRRLASTPGGKILRLKVAAEDGSELDKKKSLYRAGMSVVSLYALGIGYLWGLFEAEHRGWHDLVAGTRVVAA